MPKSTGEKWMGAPAVASHLGVTLRTVYAIIDEGQLPAFKIRRVIRLRREDVDQYLERCRIKPGELRHLYPATSEEDEWGPGEGSPCLTRDKRKNRELKE